MENQTIYTAEEALLIKIALALNTPNESKEEARNGK